jgi:hypothetical protein
LYVADSRRLRQGARRVPLGGPVHGFVAWDRFLAVLWGGFGAVERLEILAWDADAGKVVRHAELPVSDAGGWRAMCRHGDRVVFPTVKALVGVDLRRPDRPRWAGELELFPVRGSHPEGPISACVASVDTGHVALWRGNRVAVVDTSDPRRWSVASEAVIPLRITHLTPIRPYQAVAAGLEGVHLVVLTPDAEPRIIATLDERPAKRSTAAADHRLYVVDPDAGLRLFAIHNWRASERGRWPLDGVPQRVTDCAVGNGWVYLAAGEAGVLTLPTARRIDEMGAWMGEPEIE